jgi:hypothetical protein
VEADFSIINWEKDDVRTSLTDMSQEGIMHSKQYAYMALLRHQESLVGRPVINPDATLQIAPK